MLVAFGRPLKTEEVVGEVVQLSTVYNQSRDQLELQSNFPKARFGFYLTRDMLKLQRPLLELSHTTPALFQNETFTLLDLGSGLGAMIAGVAHHLLNHAPQVTSLEVVSVEKSPALSNLLQTWVSTWNREISSLRIHVTYVDADITVPPTHIAPHAFDLITFGFVLNELFVSHPQEIQQRLRLDMLHAWLEFSGPLGTCIVLDPALKAVSRDLQHLRLQFEAPWRVVAPCTHLAACPMLEKEHDWCHDETEFLLPEPLRSIAEKSGLRYEGLSYAYLTLAKSPVHGSKLLRVLSHPLKSKGKTEWKVCASDGVRTLRLLDRDQKKQPKTTQRKDVEATKGDLILDSGMQRLTEPLQQMWPPEWPTSPS